MIGFIGTGNMGSAMLGGIIKSGLCPASEILISDASPEALKRTAAEWPGIGTTGDNEEVIRKADILILAVKPHIYPIVLKEAAPLISTETLVVTIAAGVTLEKMTGWLSEEHKIIRTMPNTPALVGEGMTALCPNGNVTERDLDRIKEIFSSFGKWEVLPESQINGFTSLCGSSPAWIFMMIEALADGAVLEGLPRAKAYTMASQAVLGSAKMVLETGKVPAELKDMVCSPGGTTIEAVSELESHGFRSALIEAVRVCTNKADFLSGE
ncbi:MAG: pyrroline-5-carboxylate reductase [Spirochaetales bacterium]|nr:pyrroline-5-carboxylate reductase [Spirochaetales bacterium]